MYDPTWIYAWEIFISSNRDIKFLYVDRWIYKKYSYSLYRILYKKILRRLSVFLPLSD